MVASATHAAESAASLKQYTFDLVTLNLSSTARKGQAGGALRIHVASTMTDEEVESVKQTLNDLKASQPDSAGYRQFAMSSGTRVRIGGFIEDPDVAGAGVQKLPIEFSVKGDFSTAEAALVLRLATTANLFVSSPTDPTVVATTYAVTDKPFLKDHPRASVAYDEKSLVEWVQQNIPAREVPDDSGR